ncbi:MAG: GTPase Era [Chlorobi bacterium]|nr:GTPase Era [Chlorobiota bacterium]
MAFKSGFVNIIGNPNVGKSTFLNAMLDYDLAITTPKAQTTRHRILGIDNGEDYQIIYSDTPGVIKPAYELQKYMMEAVNEALDDADILLLMVTPDEEDLKDEQMWEKLRRTDRPVFVLINKIDTTDQPTLEKAVEKWKERLPQAKIFPVSALHRFGLDTVKKHIIEALPKNPPYFERDQLTDRPERFLVSEKIREKILQHYKKEIPYAVEVVTEEFKETDDMIRIRATIYVERDSQKGILIGKGGSALKRIGMEARKDLEKLFGKKVFLELYVKVRKNWRKDDRWLQQFGYKK